MRPAHRALATVSLLILATRCGNLLGVDKYSVGSPAKDADAPSTPYVSEVTGYVSAECGRCIDQHCANEAAACSLDDSCNVAHGCLAACAPDDPDCPGRCNLAALNTNFLLSPETGRLATCRDSNCLSPCGATPRGENGHSCGMSWVTTSCTECCCDEFKACDDDEACVRALNCDPCTRDPTTWSSMPASVLRSDHCFKTCMGDAIDSPTSWETKLDALNGCRFGACSSRCTNGRGFEADDWTCLGHLREVKASAAPVTIFVGVADFTTPASNIQDVLVDECAVGSDCQTPLRSASSGSIGVAEFPDEQPAGFTGTIRSYFRALAVPNFYPLILHYWGGAFTHTSVFNTTAPTRTALDGLAGGAGVQLSPDHGHIAFAVFSCSGQSPTTPVIVRLTSESDPTTNMVAVPPSQSNDPLTTTTNAFGFAFNVPAGQFAKLEYSIARDGGVERVGEATVFVRADSLTVVGLFPTP